MDRRDVKKAIIEIKKQLAKGVELEDIEVEGFEQCEESLVSVENFEGRLTKAQVLEGIHKDIHKYYEGIHPGKVWVDVYKGAIQVCVNCSANFRYNAYNSTIDVSLFEEKLRGEA